MWTNLEAFVNQNLGPEVRTLVTYAAGDAFPPDQVPWMRGAKEALEGLEQACQERDAKQLKRPTERLLRVLGEEPNKFNTRLVSAAERLPLSRVVQGLERIRDEAGKAQFDAAAEGRLREFCQGVPALAEMDQHLQGLVANHNVLQYVSFTLRPLSSPSVDVEDVKALRSELEEALGRLNMGAASDWALRFFKAWENLAQALAALTAEPQVMRKVRSSFFSFCGSVNTGFNQVDIDLFKFCERLQKVGGKLDQAIEEMKRD